MGDRTTYIGSTESGALVEPGISPFCSEYSIFCSKVGLIPERIATERMKAGKYLERAILREWNARNERNFVFNDEPFFYDDKERIGATPDGIEGREGAEVKTVTRERRADWNNGAPRYVWWQAQHEMLCADLDRIVVIAQFGFDELAHEWIAANIDAQRQIIESCLTMWDRIDGKLPPPDADGSDATTEALKARELIAKAVELPPDVREWTEALARAKAHIKLCKAEEQALENKIRAALGDATTGIFGDGSGWRVQTINVKARSQDAYSYTKLVPFKPKDAEKGNETWEPSQSETR